MNILEALEQISRGKKVRRPSWPEGDFMGLGACTDPPQVGMQANGVWGHVKSIWISTVRATDFEVVADDYGV